MGKSGEFFTFDQVISFLSIDETKLKRLVSEGEIRAFREGDEMKFRKSDVENLDLIGARSEEETGVIDLSAGRDDSSETLTDDLIFDEGDDLDLTSAEAGMATAEISSQDTFVDEDGVGMSTEPLGMDPGEMTEVVDMDDDDYDDEPDRGVSSRRAPRQTAPPEEPSDLAWGALMFVTTVLLVMGVIVVMGIRDGNLIDGVPGQLAIDIAGLLGGK